MGGGGGLPMIPRAEKFHLVTTTPQAPIPWFTLHIAVRTGPGNLAKHLNCHFYELNRQVVQQLSYTDHPKNRQAPVFWNNRPGQLPRIIIMPKTERYELRTNHEFIEKLNKVSRESGLSKPEAIGAGIDLLERLIEAEREGKEFALVNKN